MSLIREIYSCYNWLSLDFYCAATHHKLLIFKIYTVPVGDVAVGLVGAKIRKEFVFISHDFLLQ